MAKYIRLPLDEKTAHSLVAGEEVYLSGTILTARDMAHKRLCQSLEKGETLPIDLNRAIIYYTGPSPAKSGFAVGSAGPTTAGRMDNFTIPLMQQGIAAMIGKGYRAPHIMDAIKKYKVPYFVSIGGAGALIAQSIKKYTVLAYEDLGTEAIAALEVENFPAIVAIDIHGNNAYEQGQSKYRC